MANTQNLDLVKPLGTDHALVSVLNSNSDKIDAYAGAVNAGLDGLRDGLGILANGNTHAAITSGQFVYVKNHQTLPEGLYKATANIAANGTLSTSNLAADSAGGLNALNEQIATKAETHITSEEFSGSIYVRKSANTVTVWFDAFKKSTNGTTSVVIPSDYRPKRNIRCVLLNGDATKSNLMAIRTSGDLDVTAEDTNAVYYGSVTYVV